MLIYALFRQLSRVAFTHFLSSNPPVCKKGGGDQANFGNAMILRAPVIAIHPLLERLEGESSEVGSYLYRLKDPTKAAGSMSSSFGLSLDKTNQFLRNPCQYNSHFNVLHVIIAHAEIVHKWCKNLFFVFAHHTGPLLKIEIQTLIQIQMPRQIRMQIQIDRQIQIHIELQLFLVWFHTCPSSWSTFCQPKWKRVLALKKCTRSSRPRHI